VSFAHDPSRNEERVPGQKRKAQQHNHYNCVLSPATLHMTQGDNEH